MTSLRQKLQPLIAQFALGLAADVIAAPPPAKVIAAEVMLEEFADRLEALGTTSANESVEITATVTETISTRPLHCSRPCIDGIVKSNYFCIPTTPPVTRPTHSAPAMV